MIPLFVAKDATSTAARTGIAFGRSSEPSLKEPRQQYRYRSSRWASASRA